ncbi:hypothetical protein TWF696_000716 [Orbilia brochopaga]|uniref:Jacalin-type lectin domain-containing protein n=1 Tax=Orbilia brochopaga TaxID=3140254 RepID=A0AAV9VDB7_9PEZI
MLSKFKLSSLRRRSRQSLAADAKAQDPLKVKSERLNNWGSLTPSNSSPSLVSTAPTLESSIPGGHTPPSISSQHSIPPILPRPATALDDTVKDDLPLLRRQSVYTSHSAPTVPSTPHTAPNAPRILSINDGSWAFASVLLVFGQCGPPNQPQDGTVIVHHHHCSFPSTSWPVSDGYFRALVHLEPGPNRLEFEYISSKAASPVKSHMTLHMMPLAAPPLHLVILLGRDSPATFDCPPEKMRTQGNGLDAAIRKFRMAAYLWQAYTAEEMVRNKFGRRTFRFEEEWSTQSISHRDKAPRMVPRVHVLRCDKTVAEIRDLEIAQQNPNGARKGELWEIAVKAVREHFDPKSVYERRHVAVLILDSKWDTRANMITGHAALGGGAGHVQMGIFGSHSLHSWPMFIEDVVPAFTDCTRTDTKIVANDAGESGSYWEACTVGIGAFLHEVGHAFGCPHQPSGIMVRDYVRLNRSFVTRESYSTRTKNPGLRLCMPKDECHWHRLDILRFRFHPCFRSASDPPIMYDGDNPRIYGVDNGVVIASSTGVAWVEIYINDVFQNHIEVFPKVERNYVLSEADVLSKIPNLDKNKHKKIKLSIWTIGNGHADVDDFLAVVHSTVKLPGGGKAFRSMRLGLGGGVPTETILPVGANRVLNAIHVYSSYALHGIEFTFDDNSTVLFGHQMGSHAEFPLDTRKGETLLGFSVRSGFWVDGCDVLTTLGRRSPFFGNSDGGTHYTMIPPRGHQIVGIAGSVGQHVDSFSILYR